MSIILSDFNDPLPHQTETVLWTNPSPNVAFNSSSFDLSDDIDNYDYIGVYWKFRYDTSNNVYSYIQFTPSDLKKSKSTTADNILSFGAWVNNYYFNRLVLYSTNTRIGITGCYAWNYASNGDNLAIPLKVVGVSQGKIEVEKIQGNITNCTAVAYGVVSANGGTKTVTIDPTLNYSLGTGFNYGDSNMRAGTTLINKGVMVYNYSASNSVITLSGTTLTIKNVNTAGYYLSYYLSSFKIT